MSTASPSRGLLDTSVVIDLGHFDPDDLPDEALICTVTLAELSVGPLAATTEEERAIRQMHLQHTEADFDPLPFDASAARAFGPVAARLRASGRKPAARAYDALIAAVAISQDLPLYTANPRDVAGIEGLDLRDVRPRT